MAEYNERNPHRKDNVPTPAQRAAALVNDASLQLQRQDGDAFQDVAALLQSMVPHIEALDRGAA